MPDLGEPSFEDFLQSRGLTPNLIQFIIYSIASVPAGVPFREVSPQTEHSKAQVTPGNYQMHPYT